MQTAYLYIRVSTDEQAKKGFSIGNQQDVLDYYCLTNNLNILQCFREDYSAKDFHRPGWSQLFAQCTTHKKDRPSYILFTQWSRFSRNITEAYIMIKRLHSLGIIPQAVEQTLDMNVPENKMVLANYIAAAEVENERRSLNVKVNMYKAKLEGRWGSGAPIGYRNVVSVSGQKYIAIYEPEAALLINAFEQVCEGIFSIPQIYNIGIAKGLKCSLNNFRNILRNPLYCGRIIVNPDNNLIPVIVEGQHEKLISPVLFDKAQQVFNLKNRKRKQKSKEQLNELFPFRGLLLLS